MSDRLEHRHLASAIPSHPPEPESSPAVEHCRPPNSSVSPTGPQADAEPAHALSSPVMELKQPRAGVTGNTVSPDLANISVAGQSSLPVTDTVTEPELRKVGVESLPEQSSACITRDFVPPDDESDSVSSNHRSAEAPLSSPPASPHRTSPAQNTVNQLVIEPIQTNSSFTVRELKHVRDVDAKPYGLANIKLGLHATEGSSPSWQFALLDSGCTENLISMKALQEMSDFASIKVTTSQAKSLRTANNDESQVILGKVTIYVSLLDQDRNRICFRIPFLVVSGLTHEIFIGQPFLTSGHIHKETRDALFFYPDDNKPGQKLHQIAKIYLSRRKAQCSRKTVIPPTSAVKVNTNLLLSPPAHDETFATFRPSARFLRDYPDLHMLYQTVQYEKEGPISVMVVNVTDRPVTIKHASSLGYFQTFHKDGTIVHSLSDFVQDAPAVEKASPQELNELLPQCYNLSVDNFIGPLREDDSYIACNAAYTPSLHEHKLSDEERAERNKQYKNEGYFQKSVSEVLEQSNQNMPSFEYTGKDQFKSKTDAELLADVDLSHLTPEQRKQTLAMLKRNIHAFQRHSLDIGLCTSVTAYAPLNTPDPPILYTKYVPIPAKYKQPAMELITKYVNCGVLAPTDKPCRFTSNIFIIPKKDGTFRLIFDGRLISKYCQQLPLSLGNLDELFSNLSGKTLVSKLDVSQAYFQIGVTEETSQLLSFFGPDSRRYAFKRTAQGLKFSSFFMEQMMSAILFGIPEAQSYCDDVFIATSGSFSHHLGVFEKVIKSFIQHNVRLNIAKLEIAPPCLDFLGLTWSKDKLSIPKSKITGYLNLKKPTSLKQARFLVNSMAYYRRFIPRFSHHIAPILDLLKENPKKFVWTKEHQAAVDALIAIIEKGVSLYLPRFDRPFIIHVDASHVAIGATVSQRDNSGHLRLVAAVSRSFIKSERKLAPVQKEILGLLYTLTSLHYLLKGHHLIVFADARSITLLKTCSSSSPYLARLALELSAYDFELYHLEGSLNIEADALSRMHKLQDKILAQDKHNNNAMTKEESLLFLEYLKIPNNTRFTVEEVRHFLTSEPLRSQLAAKIKTRNTSCLKSPTTNMPTVIKAKKVHEPRYSDSHPMERPDFRPEKPPRRKPPAKSPKRSRSSSPYRSKSPQIHSIVPSFDISKLRSRALSPAPSKQIQFSTVDFFSPPSSPDLSATSQGESTSAPFPAYEEAGEQSRSSTPNSIVVPFSYFHDDDTESVVSIGDSPPNHETPPLSASPDSDDEAHHEVSDSHQDLLSITPNLFDPGNVDTLDFEQVITEMEQPCLMPTCVLHSTCLPSSSKQDSKDNPSHQDPGPQDLDPNPVLRPPVDIPTIFVLNNTVGVENEPLSITLDDVRLKSEIVNTGILSVDEFRKAQLMDTEIQKIASGCSPDARHISLNDGILYRNLNNRSVPYLPTSLETFLFNCQHFHVLSGHRSADAMAKAISEQFYVPNLKQKLQAFTNQCYICAVAKSQRMQKTTQGTTEQALFPKHILSFDIFGAVVPDDSGHRYVYSFIDNFSLFVINIKAKTRSTEEILAAFLQVFAIFSSIPSKVCSDQETALLSPKAADFFASFGITHSFSSSHAHWRLLSEGASIRKSKEFMRSVMLSNSTSDWFQALQLATFALNNTKTLYDYTPQQLFYGNSKNQIDLFQSVKKFTDLDTYLQDTTQRYNRLIESVNLQRALTINKRNNDINANRKSKKFEKGDIVWLKALNISPHRATKMQQLGPFVIMHKINNFTFKLATLEKPDVCARISHASHLELFHSNLDLTSIQFPSNML